MTPPATASGSGGSRAAVDQPSNSADAGTLTTPPKNSGPAEGPSAGDDAGSEDAGRDAGSVR